MSCGKCYDGLFEVRESAAIYGGAMITRMYACLCPRGRARLQTVRGVEQVLPAEDVEQQWPAGTVPTADPYIADRLTHANVPAACRDWTLDTYRTRFTAAKAQAASQFADQWLALDRDKRSDLVLFGDHGTGKTGLAIALLRACVERGDAAHFWTVKHLSIVWRATYDRPMLGGDQNQQREVDLLDQLTAPDLVVLDEFGGTGLTDFVESTLTLIVDRRQKALKPTIITVNLSKADAEGGKKVVGERIAALFGPTLTDRLRERAKWFALVGKSERKAWGGDEPSMLR